jgi:hypothetical protein
MSVIKRDVKASTSDLGESILKFVSLLRDQGDDDACEVLLASAELLKKGAPGTESHKKAVAQIIDAFDEYELMAYTLAPKTDAAQWTVADELCDASSRVLSLAKRFK